MSRCQSWHKWHGVHRAGDEGFTLLEVLIALAIIVALLTTVISSVNYHLSIVERHRIITIATMLARQKLEESNRLKTMEEKGAFADPYTDYAYTIRVYQSAVPAVLVKELTVTMGQEEVVVKEFLKKPS